MEREYVVAGIGLLGLAIGSFLTGFWGYQKAKKEGITNLTVEEIRDRTNFQKLLIDQHNATQADLAELRNELRDCRAELIDCRKELEECREDRNALNERMKFLETKTITYRNENDG